MTTLDKKNIINYLVDNNYCVMDNVCVFCSVLTDGWNRFCYSCKDHKGMMSLYDAVLNYGTDVLPK